MKILVTGASGFIGRWVMETVGCAGHQTVAFCGDVRDRRTFPNVRVDVIIHMAALVDKKFWKSGQISDVNVNGTQNLADHYPGVKMVFMSSADVESEALTEYGQSKKRAEHVVAKHPENLIIRPPSVFGPGDTHDKLIPRLLAKYLDGKKCTVRDDHEGEYLYVKRLARLVADALGREGLMRFDGVRIGNRLLESMVCAVCARERITGLSVAEMDFVADLAEYVRYEENCLEK